VSFLNNQQSSPDPKDVNKLKFSFSYDMASRGIQQLQDLPKKQEASELLYLEQQAWQKAGIQFKVDTQGQTWPTGFKSIPPNVSVNRHATEVTGSLTLMKDFLDRYPSGIYWNQISMKIEPKNLDAAVIVTLKGALYAY
jgi:outer membrane protein assembly factor BamD (BamD/ComL family)